MALLLLSIRGPSFLKIGLKVSKLIYGLTGKSGILYSALSFSLPSYSALLSASFLSYVFASSCNLNLTYRQGALYIGKPLMPDVIIIIIFKIISYSV
jgi:hypothetical protein